MNTVTVTVSISTNNQYKLDYIASLSNKDKHALSITEKYFGDTFNILTTSGFQEWFLNTHKTHKRMFSDIECNEEKINNQEKKIRED